MNKYLIIAASALALAGCSSDDFLGDGSGNGQNSAAIQFGGGTTKTHRATSNGTYKIADLQRNGFWVYGTKHTNGAEKENDANDQVVYKNYYLNHDGNKNNTQSNTAGWEYVGVDNSKYRANVTPSVNENVAQTIKYWDYSAKAYTFYAATAKPADVEEGKVKIEKITGDDAGTVYTKGYNVTLKDGAAWDELYFADRKVITKPAATVTPSHGAENVYGGEVKFTFRNALTKVRVAMYETIPGYSVTIDRFYYTNDGDAGQITAETGMFKADASNTPLKTSETGVIYKVVYYNDTEAGGQLVNQPKMSPKDGAGATKTVLTLGNNLKADIKLSDIITAPTYDTNGGNYTLFMPQADNDKTLSLKVDYTLTSLDGSGEKIYVKGATAVIPAKYLCWRPNYAYTYLFKISDNTNGSTGGDDDPAGLYPITFDASVVETETGNVEYISAMGTATITTFAVKGNLYQHDKADYENGSDLYATVVEKDKSTVALGTGNTKVYKLKAAGADAANLSEALVANWVANNKTDYYEEVTVANDNFVNTVPTEDGKSISLGGTATALKIAGVAAGKYVIGYKAKAPWTGAYEMIYKIVTVK